MEVKVDEHDAALLQKDTQKEEAVVEEGKKTE
jgi:hypothetical protein